MSRIRTDLWVAAFVRRMNDRGHICVVERRGDAVAGQVFVDHDHLDGTFSLYTPAPIAARLPLTADLGFVRRLDHVERPDIAARIARERDMDPDLWVIGVECREPDLGLTLVPIAT